MALVAYVNDLLLQALWYQYLVSTEDYPFHIAELLENLGVLCQFRVCLARTVISSLNKRNEFAEIWVFSSGILDLSECDGLWYSVLYVTLHGKTVNKVKARTRHGSYTLARF